MKWGNGGILSSALKSWQQHSRRGNPFWITNLGLSASHSQFGVYSPLSTRPFCLMRQRSRVEPVCIDRVHRLCTQNTPSDLKGLMLLFCSGTCCNGETVVTAWWLLQAWKGPLTYSPARGVYRWPCTSSMQWVELTFVTAAMHPWGTNGAGEQGG